MMTDDRELPLLPAALGVAGVLPFALLGLAAIFGIEDRFAVAPGLARAGLVAYGVVIASFLGGVRWGIALRNASGSNAGLYIVSVVPSLVAWVALFAPQPIDLAILIALFLVMGVSDVLLARGGTAPRWYGTLRTLLTGLVVSVLVAALAFAPFGG